MLEYFAYKKVKKHKAEKAAKEEPVKKAAETSRLAAPAEIDLSDAGHSHHQHVHHRRRRNGEDECAIIRPEDENFLEQLISDDDVPAPPLPPRLYSRDLDWQVDNEVAATATATESSTTDTNKKSETEAAAKKPGRFALLFTRSHAKKVDNKSSLKPSATTTAAAAGGVAASPAISPAEQEQEAQDLTKVLDRLNLSVKNNKVISTDSSSALASFTNVFKDLVNGVPTAYDDVMKIIEDKDGALAKGFDKLPNSMKKLVTQLPDKITTSLAPELLAAAAASQGIKAETSGGLKGTAKNVFMPTNLAQLITKPGAIVGMLKAIVEVLKTRWPAFIGVNVIWGVALSPVTTLQNG
ncbi:hypothetical protein AAL_06404 [Moelleriella libera RCEF 2490]|uniref:Uncharacterized protein n=1 Tax=Moelleriella libera RCEF 2490 TaxID=1081109 RepID=A0A167Z5F6_9HYPO|nr:hypothetical protein AAL_06404 [Moelleriella libera RCEF 2490]